MRFTIENIGIFLKEKRTSVSLTLKQVAEQTGLSKGYISRLENGSSSPSLETLYKLASILEFNMEDVCTFDEIHFEPNQPVELESVLAQLPVQIDSVVLSPLMKSQMVKLLEYIHRMDWSDEINKIQHIHHLLSVVDDIKRGN